MYIPQILILLQGKGYYHLYIIDDETDIEQFSILPKETQLKGKSWILKWTLISVPLLPQDSWFFPSLNLRIYINSVAGVRNPEVFLTPSPLSCVEMCSQTRFLFLLSMQNYIFPNLWQLRAIELTLGQENVMCTFLVTLHTPVLSPSERRGLCGGRMGQGGAVLPGDTVSWMTVSG